MSSRPVRNALWDPDDFNIDSDSDEPIVTITRMSGPAPERPPRLPSIMPTINARRSTAEVLPRRSLSPPVTIRYSTFAARERQQQQAAAHAPIPSQIFPPPWQPMPIAEEEEGGARARIRQAEEIIEQFEEFRNVTLELLRELSATRSALKSATLTAAVHGNAAVMTSTQQQITRPSTSPSERELVIRMLLGAAAGLTGGLFLLFFALYVHAAA